MDRASASREQRDEFRTFDAAPDLSAGPSSPLMLPVQGGFLYQSTKIHERGEIISLTDMWKAAGSPSGRAPNDWYALTSSREFIAHITAAYIAGNPGNKAEAVWVTKPGRNGGTWGHWQTAMAYAKYLDVAFHAACNVIVRAHMEGRRNSSSLSMDEQARAIIGGIARGVIQKALAERLEPVERAMLELTEQFRTLSAPSGQFKTSIEFLPALSVAEQHAVPKKGRTALCNRLSAALRRYSTIHDHPTRIEAHSKRWLFHVEAIKRFLDAGGIEIIRQHLDALTRQSRISIPKGDRKASLTVINPQKGA